MKNSMPMRFILLLSTALLFAGCGEKSGEDNTSPEQFNPFDVTWSSGCRNGLLHAVSFDYAAGRFSGNSIRYRDVNCTEVSRVGRNVLGGYYTVGDDSVVSGGFVVSELDIVYDASKVANVSTFDPAPFDIAYLDPNTKIVYLGLKTSTRPGTSRSTRPTAIDFNNAWTTQ
jgi:hypothetical protein